ncbi:hypothetical protein GQ44DRAFT_721330 [Phaeosphaeriaceae sp. PMI808]|nr:hypothetical protein GQ44DRAFT_721330 [Phaeosphaeriaceae sp. PMI808]
MVKPTVLNMWVESYWYYILYTVLLGFANITKYKYTYSKESNMQELPVLLRLDPRAQVYITCKERYFRLLNHPTNLGPTRTNKVEGGIADLTAADGGNLVWHMC